jgi:hypothetical protein
MRCFICNRNENEVMIMRLPVETVYENVHLHIVGNVKDKEFMCLPCIGFQFDEMFRRQTICYGS